MEQGLHCMCSFPHVPADVAFSTLCILSALLVREHAGVPSTRMSFLISGLDCRCVWGKPTGYIYFYVCLVMYEEVASHDIIYTHKEVFFVRIHFNVRQTLWCVCVQLLCITVSKSVE